VTCAAANSLRGNPSGDCGDNVFWELDLNTNVLRITGNGSMSNYDAQSNPAPWYDYADEILKLDIGDSVQAIGVDAFNELTALESVSIGESILGIGERAFYGCSSLKSVVIPDSVFYVGDEGFSSCSDLTSAIIGNSVSSLPSKLFEDCSALKTVTIGDSVTYVEPDAFDGCDELVLEKDNCAYYLGNEKNKYRILFKGIDDDVSSCKIHEGTQIINLFAFESRDDITAVIIPNSVTRIGDGAFSDCTSLEKVNIANSVTKIGEGAFDGCDNLAVKSDACAVYLGNSDNEYYALVGVADDEITSCAVNDKTVVIADYALAALSELQTVTLGKSVAWVGKSAFYSCDALETVTVPSSVISIGEGAFEGCSQLQYNTYNDGLYLGNNNNPYHALISEDVPFGGTADIHPKTKVIAGKAFEGTFFLFELTIPDSVVTIGSNAFSSCLLFVSVIIPDSVTLIEDEAFAYDIYLYSVVYLGKNDPGKSSFSVFYYNLVLANVTVTEEYEDELFCGKPVIKVDINSSSISSSTNPSSSSDPSSTYPSSSSDPSSTNPSSSSSSSSTNPSSSSSSSSTNPSSSSSSSSSNPNPSSSSSSKGSSGSKKSDSSSESSSVSGSGSKPSSATISTMSCGLFVATIVAIFGAILM